MASDLPDNTRSKHLEQPRGYRHEQNQDRRLNDGAHTQVNHRRWCAGNGYTSTEKNCDGDREHCEWQTCQYKNHKNAEDMTFA
ncbi:MAG: hypothetical protein WA697_09625, partial [Pseudolabrys sp.]